MRGVSDIIGVLTQEYKGEKFGNILCIEVKQPGNQPTDAQRIFLNTINNAGGIGICVHSVDELERLLEDYL